MKPRTLRGRIALAAAGAILLAAAVFVGVAGVVVDGELHASLDRALRQRAGEVARLAVSAPSVLSAPGALEAPVGGRQLAVEVLDARGRIVARSLALGARLLPVDATARAAIARARSGYEDTSLGGARLRVYAAPIAQAGGPASGGAVLVASELSDLDRSTRRVRIRIALSGIAAALAAGLLAAILTRRGLRPLRRLSSAAREIERTGDASRRLPPIDTADELGELTGVLNAMLAALDDARERERRFLADASHELRTPLTALLGNVDFIARHGADASAIADLKTDAERLRRIVEDLLTLERERAAVAAPTDVALDELARAAAEVDPRVVVDALEPASVRGDADALERALGNLVANGLLHGPPAGEVHIELRREDGLALLSVRDEGPGPAPEHVGELFERFWRAPDARARPGSGLGLALVRAVAERHGGEVRVEGARFTLALPEASTPQTPASHG